MHHAVSESGRSNSNIGTVLPGGGGQGLAGLQLWMQSHPELILQPQADLACFKYENGDDERASERSREVGPCSRSERSQQTQLVMLTIRKAQMQALNGYMKQSFEDRMVRHLSLAFRPQYQAMLDPKGGDKEVRKFIQLGVNRASRYGIATERDVALFIEIMAVAGTEFETKPENRWAAAILHENISGEDKVWLIQNRLQKARGRPS